jgi:hypothetical protein
VTAPMTVMRHHLWRRRRRNNFWFVLIERTTATAAETIGCSELNQQATVATDNFPGIYRGKSCSHLVWEGQSQLSLEPKTKFQLMRM